MPSPAGCRCSFQVPSNQAAQPGRSVSCAWRRVFSGGSREIGTGGSAPAWTRSMASSSRSLQQADQAIPDRIAGAVQGFLEKLGQVQGAQLRHRRLDSVLRHPFAGLAVARKERPHHLIEGGRTAQQIHPGRPRASHHHRGARTIGRAGDRVAHMQADPLTVEFHTEMRVEALGALRH